MAKFLCSVFILIILSTVGCNSAGKRPDEGPYQTDIESDFGGFERLGEDALTVLTAPVHILTTPPQRIARQYEEWNYNQDPSGGTYALRGATIPLVWAWYQIEDVLTTAGATLDMPISLFGLVFNPQPLGQYEFDHWIPHFNQYNRSYWWGGFGGGVFAPPLSTLVRATKSCGTDVQRDRYYLTRPYKSIQKADKFTIAVLPFKYDMDRDTIVGSLKRRNLDKLCELNKYFYATRLALALRNSPLIADSFITPSVTPNVDFYIESEVVFDDGNELEVILTVRRCDGQKLFRRRFYLDHDYFFGTLPDIFGDDPVDTLVWDPKRRESSAEMFRKAKAKSDLSGAEEEWETFWISLVNEVSRELAALDESDRSQIWDARIRSYVGESQVPNRKKAIFLISKLQALEATRYLLPMTEQLAKQGAEIENSVVEWRESYLIARREAFDKKMGVFTKAMGSTFNFALAVAAAGTATDLEGQRRADAMTSRFVASATRTGGAYKKAKIAGKLQKELKLEFTKGTEGTAFRIGDQVLKLEGDSQTILKRMRKLVAKEILNGK